MSGLPSFPERFNLARYLLEHNLDAGRAEKVALRWRDERHTYAGLAAASSRLAHAFRDLGLRMEERVLIAVSDRPEFSHAWFATLKCGAVFAMVNPQLAEEDYAAYLEYTRARIAVVDESLAPMFARLAKTARHLRAVVVAGGESSRTRPQLEAGQHALLDLVAHAPATPVMEDTHLHDVAGWLFTSGSTGRPKAAVHFHEDFAFNVETYAKQVLGIREDDVTAGVPKLFFGYATGTNLMFPFAVGGSTALFSERSTPEVIFDVVERYRPTILTSVPTMIGKMLALEAEAGSRDLSSLRLVLSAGEKLPEALQTQWLARCGVEILDGIGSAELFHIHISNRPGAVRVGSLGQVVPGYECSIVDPEGHPVPAGQVGRLQVRGESAALCYWQAHEKSKETFAGDLVITGDMFRVDADGYYFYEGRADELLKVGGVWCAPHEIEDCLLGHEAVAEAAVVGWRDKDELVKPKAFVVARSGHAPRDAAGAHALAHALQEWVKARLAVYKYPRWVEFLDELPKSDRGKVDRKSLKARQDG
ncbi:MAG TPA: benzoate-CoA ligase family protein [Planctomycetota bacterium]|nr:benzoate-CoA ligase family protein [Planctomycetota bacterium]